MHRTVIIGALAFALLLAQGASAARPQRYCGTKQLYGHSLRLRVVGKLISCSRVHTIVRGWCKDGKAWSCFSFHAPAPVLVWFPSRERFRAHWSTVIEARRYPCSQARVSRHAWAAARRQSYGQFPTKRQVLADDLLRCHQLRSKTYPEVRALLGRPESNDVEQGDRYLLYDLGPERDSFFQVDNELLAMRFGRHGSFKGASIVQG